MVKRAFGVPASHGHDRSLVELIVVYLDTQAGAIDSLS